MNAKLIKDGLGHLERYIPFVMPAMSWRFAAEPPRNAIVPEKDSWSCMFLYIKAVASGKKLCLSADNPGCSGAACYLGFKKTGAGAGSFLAGKEKFKKSVELGEAFYKEINAISSAEEFIVLERTDDLAYDEGQPQVITLWVDAASLSGLVTLANYDRETNENVLIPFASGCQSVWTIPYKEQFSSLPRCVVGTMDPAVRAFLPKETMAFSLPVKRFVELAENIKGSFLQTDLWKQVVIRPAK